MRWLLIFLIVSMAHAMIEDQTMWTVPPTTTSTTSTATSTTSTATSTTTCSDPRIYVTKYNYTNGNYSDWSTYTYDGCTITDSVFKEKCKQYAGTPLIWPDEDPDCSNFNESRNNERYFIDCIINNNCVACPDKREFTDIYSNTKYEYDRCIVSDTFFADKCDYYYGSGASDDDQIECSFNPGDNVRGAQFATCISTLTCAEVDRPEDTNTGGSGYSAQAVSRASTTSYTTSYTTCSHCTIMDEAWNKVGYTKVFVPGSGLVEYERVYPPVVRSTASVATATTADCNGMVDKLYLAAEDMKAWNRESWDNPDPCGGNACCSMNEQVDGQRACSVGIPYSTCGSAKGCCGAYIWHLFDIAIHKHGVALSWPYKGESSSTTKPNSFWPAHMEGHQKIKLRENGQVVEGNPDVHSNLKPGDMIYLQWENNDGAGCRYDSHILLVGKVSGDSFEYLDVGNMKRPVASRTVRQYLDYTMDCDGNMITRKNSNRVWIWRTPLCK